jgi:hypothetical protein
MPASPESADTTRSSSAKLEALLAKLAVRTLELDKAAAEAGRRGSDSGSDESDCDSRAAVTQDEYTYAEAPRSLRFPGIVRDTHQPEVKLLPLHQLNASLLLSPFTARSSTGTTGTWTRTPQSAKT